VKKPGELGTVAIAHKIPNGLGADQPALAVMDSIAAEGSEPEGRDRPGK